MGLLDGLEKLGIVDIFTDGMYDAKEVAPKNDAPTIVASRAETKLIPSFVEADCLFRKTYDCPVCDAKYRCLTVKSGSIRPYGTDKDLKPLYDGIEPIKYEALVCPVCGYGVMSRYLKPLGPSQKKWLKESIGSKYNNTILEKSVLDYDEALDRISLVLASCIVKKAKASEKAYTCLKGGWICRSYIRELEDSPEPDYELIEKLKLDEKEYLDNAYQGFIVARQNEMPPVGGMDEPTLDYLIAVLAVERGHFDVASKMITEILQSVSAKARIKDKARDLKTEVLELMKKR